MRVQKSYNDSPKLYLVPTPIGNMQDMTYRAVEVLKTVDIIFCEDTRVTKKLLSHFAIYNELMSYHIYNEKERIDQIIALLNEGKSIALVSDAGMPGISDPGYLVAQKVIAEGFDCVGLPGANAGLTALVASGLPTEQFMFLGFLDHKSSQKEKQLAKVVDFDKTLIIYESPHRLLDTFKCIEKVLGNRSVVVAREISKKFEEYTRGTIREIIENPPIDKGEFVIIVKGASQTNLAKELNELTIPLHFQHYIDEGLNDKDAMRKVANDRGITKSEVYKIIKT